MNADEYGRLFEAEEAHWWYLGMRSLSAALLDGLLPPQARLLDAGCGTGRNVVELGRYGQAVGADVAAEAARFCRLRRIPFVRARIQRLPFADASFDGVICLDVLYHRQVEDDVAAVRELARVLRPGGVLLVRVPALELLRRHHDEVVHTRRRYTRGRLTALLAAAGMEILRASYCNLLLLPLVAARAAIDRIVRPEISDLAPLPPSIDRRLRRCLEIEAQWLRRFDLPIGASLVALGRKR